MTLLGSRGVRGTLGELLRGYWGKEGWSDRIGLDGAYMTGPLAAYLEAYGMCACMCVTML